jgi:hypothetical protein
MINFDFNEKLNEAKTSKELIVLRTGRASKQVSLIKKKLSNVLIEEGYEPFSCSLSTIIALLRTDTSTNTLTKVTIPLKNRIFKKYAGQDVFIYINEKTNSGNIVEGYVKKAE